MTDISAYGVGVQTTSFAMITTIYDTFSPSGVQQSTPASVLVVTTNPTFSGVQSVIAQLNGSLLVNWNSGTSGTQPLIYDIYVQQTSNVGVFSSGNRVLSTPTLSSYVFQLANGSLLISGATYYVGVRARDPLGNASINTTTISAVSAGVAPGRPLTPSDISTIVSSIWDELQSAHTVTGSFGKYLDAQVSTRATQSSVNLIPTNPLLTTDSRLNTLDANITSRASQTSVDNINTKIGTPVVTVSTDIAAVQSTANTVNSKIGTPVVSVSTDIAAVKTDSSAINTKVDVVVSTRASQASITAIDTKLGTPVSSVSTDIANVKTDTTLTGSRVDVVVSTRASQSSVTAIDTKLGTPAGISVSSDIAAVKTDSSAINTKVDVVVSTRASQASITAIDTKLGTPVSSVSTDIAAVKIDSAAIKIQTDKFSFDGSNYVNAHTKLNDDKANYVLSSASEASVVDKVWNEAKSGHTTSGTFGESNQGVVSITRANNLDFLDVAVSSRASQASVDGIQNNTDFVGVVPTTLVLPTSGSKNYPLYVRLFNDVGSPVDADSNIINISIKDSAGAIVVASTAMTRTAVGNYEYVYTVLSTDTERALFVFFDYVKNSISFNQVRSTEVQEFESKLDTLLARLTPTRATNLDYLDAAITTRASQASVDNINTKIGTPVSSVSTDIANVKTDTTLTGSRVDVVLSTRASQASVTAIDTKLGTPSGASVSIDIAAVKTDSSAINTKVDVVVSTRASQASITAIDTKLGTPVSSVSTDIAAVKTDTTLTSARVDVVVSTRASQSSVTAIDTKLGSPTGASVSADIAAVKTDTTLTGSRVDVVLSTRASQSSVNALPSNASIADAVWDEDVNVHATGTTTARTLKDAKIFSQIDL